jgi:FkbM family methyltransferase
MALGVFDEEMFRYLESRETDGAVFFDVGAHLGYHTLAFAAIGGPRTRVVAFEPNPANLARLRTNLEANEELAPRVTVLDLALADCDGVTALFTNEDVDGGGSSMGFIGSATPPAPSGVYAGAGFRPQQVSTARLDTLLEAGGLPVPDFLKIDVEGAEDLVLHGAVGLLTARKPCVLLEVHSAVAMFRVGRQLESAGYEVELLRAERDGRVQVAARPRGA